MSLLLLFQGAAAPSARANRVKEAGVFADKPVLVKVAGVFVEKPVVSR